MAKSRVLKPDTDALCALRFIKEFGLSAEQVVYRYTVAHIDKMCFEIGIPPEEGLLELEKVHILLKALFGCDVTTPGGKQDAIARHAQQIKDQKGCC